MAFSRSFLSALALIGGNPFTPLRSDIPQGSRIRRSGYVPQISGVKLRSLIRVCPGGAHGIFQTSAGPVRKPFDAETITWTPEGTVAA